MSFRSNHQSNQVFTKTYLVGLVPLYLLKKWNSRISSHDIPFANELEGTGKERASLSSNAVIQILLQFGGGVLFATVFTHLIPEIRENYENYLKSNESILKTNQNEDKKSYEIPYIEVTICLGFFLIFLVEELMHLFLNRFHEHQNKHNNCYNRDLMDRCSSLCADNTVQTESKPFSSAFVNYGADLSSTSFDTSIKRLNFIKPDVTTNGISSTTATDLWSMFFAISVHKLVIAFVVSLQLFDQSHRILLVAIHMAMFAIMSPIGILIVILSENSLLGEDSESNPIVILLTSIATGTLLYIIFYEILQKDRCERISGFIQFLSILVGFSIMLTINILLSE
ncbi:unnamed protein product [Oppiella nova]|uniref:Uncharacterized protein n=1 Tax=Oppiella nova TaxID=334625 RepID=A0A7R9M8Y6_9ACAR|nr:unnamed protein product [Oppiella nova]CAG2173014.1 unnamed protein product [Oppiella nova]